MLIYKPELPSVFMLKLKGPKKKKKKGTDKRIYLGRKTKTKKC